MKFPNAAKGVKRIFSAEILALIATNSTVNGKHSYLYPLIPFSGRALLSLFVRRKKRF